MNGSGNQQPVLELVETRMHTTLLANSYTAAQRTGIKAQADRKRSRNSFGVLFFSFFDSTKDEWTLAEQWNYRNCRRTLSST